MTTRQKVETSILAICAITVLAICAVVWYRTTEKQTAEFQPVIVVEKVQNPANGSYLVGMDNPTDKKDNPRLVFKKSTTEPTFFLVATDRNGIEYNVRVGRITFTRAKLLDTLWMEK